MKTYKRFLLVLASAAILVSPALFANSAWAQSDPIAVIVNSSNPTDNLSIGDLRKLFLSERSRWETGKSVALVMLGSGQPARTAFLKTVCGMTDADFNKYYVQAAFTGKVSSPPKEVSSPRDVISVVANSPGAVGFVRASDVSHDTTVKSVKIDGLDPTDPAYKLKM